MKKLLLFFLTAAFLIPFMGIAQNQIKGKVTDGNGKALAGATVTIKNTAVTALTDSLGNFQIKLGENIKSGSIVVTFVGYNSEEARAEVGTFLTIRMKESVNSLNDVVVVGYGTQRKATVTGSIATLTGKEVEVTKNENVVNSLAGKIPGLRITQTSSQPGAFATTMDIRGMGTPLVVVDGVPRDVDYLSRMNADEIDNISVVKDASGAVYGLRSANGVILVTTKRGTNTGNFDVQYSINYGWQQFLHVPHNVDAVQYMTLVNEQNRRDFGNNYMNYNDPSKTIYSDADFQQYLSGAKQTVDWMNAIFKKTVPQVQHNITMSGGNDKIRYYFNLGYMKQDGSLKTGSMNYNRWNFQSNVDANITKRLHASLSVGGYMDETNQPNTTIWAIYKNAWLQKPNVDIYANNNPDYLNGYLTSDNPMADINSDITGYSKYINRVFNGQMSLSWDVPKVEGLTARAMYSYDFKQGDNTDYHKAFYLYNYDSASNTYNGTLYNGVNGSNSSIQRSSYPSYNTLLQLSLNYKHSFGQHNVEAVAVYEEAYSYWDNFYAYREVSLNSQYLFAGNATNQVGNMDPNGLGDNSSKAFIGRFNYNYKGKYMAEFAFREDGSSKFPPGSRWGFFPVGSIGWRISEEPFVKNNLSILSNLKLRASYGKTGDDGDASNYPPTIVGYAINPGSAAYSFGGSVTNGVTPTSIPNPNLTWYTAKMFNIGVDFELWHGLLGGTFEWFNRNRDGLLATSSVVIPGTVGATMPQENLNSDRTFGYEVVLTHRNTIGKVSYYINAQLSATRTRNRTVTESGFGNSYDQWRNSTANRNTGIWWGKTYLGQFQNYNQIYNYPVNETNAGGTVPGDYYYEDWNGDGVIDGNDDHPIATYGLPVFNYGITLGAAWKGIDLSLNFQGSAQVYYQYTEALAQPLSFGGAGTMTQFWNRWHPADPTADIFDPSTVWDSGQLSSNRFAACRWYCCSTKCFLCKIKNYRSWLYLAKKLAEESWR